MPNFRAFFTLQTFVLDIPDKSGGSSWQHEGVANNTQHAYVEPDLFQLVHILQSNRFEEQCSMLQVQEECTAVRENGGGAHVR